MILAYMRISTNSEKQKHDRQEKAIADYSVKNGFTIDEWYKDIISGKIKTSNRPNYMTVKNRLRSGDTLIISDIDRLGRDANDTISELKDLQLKGVKTISLDIPYMNEWDAVKDDGTYNMIIDIFITLKAHMAQQEREKIVTRINQGLAVAKQKGVTLGRPKLELQVDFVKQYKKFLNGEYGKITHTGFAKMMGIGRSTLYKYIKIYEIGESRKN